MVTLSVTPSRVAAVLNAAAADVEARWHPHRWSVMAAIDHAAGYVTPGVDPAAEAATIQAWDTLTTHLDGRDPRGWELRQDSAADVAATLRAAAGGVA